MNKTQIKVLSLSWITYAIFYLIRVNYSIAIPGLIQNFGYSKAALGAAATAFFGLYAGGQFLSGQLADNLGPKKLVSIGLFISIVINLVLPPVAGFIVIITILWGLNGLFQSMGWSPNVKIVSAWFEKDLKGRASGILGTSYIVGGAVSWLIAGWLANFGWQMIFFVPTILAGIVLILWLIFAKENPEEKKTKIDFKETILTVIKDKRVWLAGFGLFGLNIVRYGFLTWAPTYFFEVQGANITLATFKAIIFPVAGALGALTAGWLSDKVFKANRTLVGLVLSIILAICLLLFLFTSSWILGLVLLAVIGFCTFGPHMLLVTELPMLFGTDMNTASVCGFIDGIGYIGAALTGVISGFLADTLGWNYSFGFWVLGAIIAGFFLFLSHTKRKDSE